MPKTKFESVMFTAMMAFFMVYLMTAVSVARNLGSLEYSVFLIAIKEMWIEYVVVFALIFFVISGLSRKLADRIFEPDAASLLIRDGRQDRIRVRHQTLDAPSPSGGDGRAYKQPILAILATQCFTVCQIVPVITLFATLYHGGFTAGWFTDWIMLAFRSFPVALLLQIFYVGPAVRFIFRRIFRNKERA